MASKFYAYFLSEFSWSAYLGNIFVKSFFFAVEVRSGSDGFSIKMRDGRNLKCVHNNPQGGHLPDYSPHPAIVLKMEDGSGLLLPIIVCMYFLHELSIIIVRFGFASSLECNLLCFSVIAVEMPSVMLMAALRNVPIVHQLSVISI